MAKIENELSIKSTFYYRKKISTFLINQMKKIEEMGHEIGYHYETLSKTNGNFEKAIKLFESELNEFRKYVSIKTICMHGASYSKYNNQLLWERYNFSDFGIIGEPYISFDYNKVNYFNDTGRSWDNNNNNFRDKVNGIKINEKIDTTDKLINYITTNQGHYLIQTHPQRWGINNFQNRLFIQRDRLTNFLKSFFIKLWENKN